MRRKTKRIIIILLLAPLGLLLLWLGYQKIKQIQAEKEHQAYVATLEHTASSQVKFLEDIVEVDYLGEKRSLAIYLPKSYSTDTISYPVIYFLDGQSLFDQKVNEGSEWEVDEVLDSLGDIGGGQAIVVGIYNSDDRLREYKPMPSDRWYSHKRVSGDQHAAWITRDLKPWIDSKYRTLSDPDHTVIGGASLGGLMAYYMLMTYPQTYHRAIVFSPSFWVNQKVYSLHDGNDRLKDLRIYFNAGELETPTVQGIQKMKEILVRSGMPSNQIALDVESELGHWHLTWTIGFRKAFPWIIE